MGDGSGAAVGPGLEENVPEPAAWNGPVAGYAVPEETVPTAKFGASEERLHEATSWVWPMKLRYADVITSWFRLPTTALALKLPLPAPIMELNWAPVRVGAPVTAKVPESRLDPWANPPPLSMNEKVPE